MHHRPYQRQEERGKRKEERGKRKEERGKRKEVLMMPSQYILFSLFSFLSPSYMRESKDLRWGTKSAINYVHLLN
ncbi:hypothetical protein AM228_11785 [Planktothricoides sp. SR001]|nr:hypothetical protein AM228_11785 [Planktothricoides sp. SR001]